MQLKISTSILGFKNYFLTYLALQTLVPPNSYLLLRLSPILNIFNVSFSSSLNRLNTLSPYQKFVQIGNAQNLGSGCIQQSCVVEINTDHSITDKSSSFESRCYLIFEVHNTLITILLKQQMNETFKVKTIINFDHTPFLSSVKIFQGDFLNKLYI